MHYWFRMHRSVAVAYIAPFGNEQIPIENEKTEEKKQEKGTARTKCLQSIQNLDFVTVNGCLFADNKENLINFIFLVN